MESNNNNNNQTTSPLYAGIFGVFCSHCDDLVTKSGNTLLIPSLRSLQRYVNSHSCYQAQDSDKLSCRKIRDELIQSHRAIQEKAERDQSFAQRQLNNIFPNGECISVSAYTCRNCGYINKDKTDFLKHFRKKRNPLSCNQLQHASDKVEVIVGENGMKCPRLIMNNILSGEFPAAFSLGPTSSPSNKRRRLGVSESSTASLVTPMQGGIAQRTPVGTYTNSKHISILFNSNLTFS